MCDKYKRDVKHPIYVLSFLNYIICKYSLLNTTMHVYHYHSCISRVNFQCISKLKITIPLPRPQMTVMASRITRQSSVCSTVCSDWQQRNITLLSLCEEHQPVTGRFPAQRDSIAENIFIWWSYHAMCFIPSSSTKLKEGYTGFTLPVYPSVRMSVCGQNRVHSVSSTILIGSFSYLHIASSNFSRCVACNVCYQIQNFKILANYICGLCL